ncbi:hypothetical protein K431DRAFT_314231 [Polychaeton citri CBS 116435]|uniref:CorA-like transporter domain-containing protein n=1 Tax=Polychaeton citri CBS 116435 TaxID=1314669 RepID=A0A9P4Q6I7_9PEZI|nr:hypothetical protein K431DRAFT_314231 [Polychaeton citri CBS 116435]
MPKPLCPFNTWLDDDEAITSHWDADSRRLFVGNNDIRMRVIDVGREYHVARSEEQLQKLMEGSPLGIRVFIVPQEFSWGSLTISEPCARLLASQLQTFPPFLQNLHAFGQRAEPSNETLGGFSAQPCQVFQRHERVYLLKCIEKHGREYLDNPYSIRQFAVYHDAQGDGSNDSFVVVNPSASSMLSQKMKMLQNADLDIPSSETIHLIMISAASQNWDDYVSWHEQALYPLTNKAHVVQENSDNPQPSSFQVTTLDMQRLQILQNSMHQALHVLDMNRTTIESLAGDLWPSFRSDSPSMNTFNQSRVRRCTADLKGAQRRLNTLLGRSDAISKLMQNIMSTRSLATLDESSKTTTELAKLAQEDNKLMLSMAAEGRRDSRTLKTITVLTLAYLPASFVSTLLGMEYISIKSSDGHWSMHFKPEMWIFAVLSVILLLVTFGLWHGLDLRKRHQEGDTLRSAGIDLEKGWPKASRMDSWQSYLSRRPNVVDEKHAATIQIGR